MRYYLRILGIMLIPIALIVGFVVGVGAALNSMKNPASYVCSQMYAKAIAALTSERRVSPSDEAKAAVNINIADANGQLAEDKGCASDSQSAVPTVTVTATTTVTATPSTSASADSWTPHFYTLDPGKTALRNFGPPVLGLTTEQTTARFAPDANGNPTNASAMAEATLDWYTRMTNDPALLCEEGGLLVGETNYTNCVKQLMSSKSARDAYLTRVRNNVASIQFVLLPAVAESKSSFMVMVDGIPAIESITVPRVEAYWAMKATTITGAISYRRMLCGWQWDEQQAAVIVVTIRSTPPTKVNKCINGNVRDKNGSCGSTPPPHTKPPTKPPTTSTPSGPPPKAIKTDPYPSGKPTASDPISSQSAPPSAKTDPLKTTK